MLGNVQLLINLAVHSPLGLRILSCFPFSTLITNTVSLPTFCVVHPSPCRLTKLWPYNCSTSLAMNETLVLSKFDELVNSGLVLYDQNQETVQHVDGELEVSLGLSEEAGLLLKESTLSFISCLLRHLQRSLCCDRRHRIRMRNATVTELMAAILPPKALRLVQ